MSAPGHREVSEQASALRRVGEERRATIDGVSLRYWEVRRGPRYLVFLHGNSMCKEVFYRQFDAFSGGEWSLLAIDLPGHGGSSDAADPARQYTIPGYADLVLQLLAELAIANPVILGWSLGGNIALELAGRGTTIAGIMLVGTPPVGPGTRDFAAAFQARALESPAMGAEATDQDLVDFVQDAVGALDPVPECFAAAAIRTDGRARETMGTHWAEGTSGHDQLSVIANWQGPIACVMGQDDALARVDFVEKADWGNLWKDEVQVLPGSSHAPFLHDPGRFNLLLRDFLESSG